MRPGVVACAALALLALPPPRALGEGPPPEPALELLAEGDSFAPGARARVVARIRLEDGWHVNAHEPSFDFLIPTRLELEAPQGWRPLAVEYPPALHKRFAFTGGQRLAVYEGEFEIRTAVDIPAEAVPGPWPVSVSVRYQACSDRVCLPPASLQRTLALTVGAEGETLHGGARGVLLLGAGLAAAACAAAWLRRRRRRRAAAGQQV